MNAVIKGSVILAVAVGILSVAFALAGLHTNPIVGGIVFILAATVINAGVIFWVLKQTAADNGYGKQLLNGLAVGVIGGVLIFLVSMLLLTVVFPDYVDEAVQANVDLLRSSGLPEAQLTAQIERLEATTPVSQSFGGLVGTFFTSLVVAAIVAIFQRRK